MDYHGLSQSMNWKIHENPLNHAVNQGQQALSLTLHHTYEFHGPYSQPLPFWLSWRSKKLPKGH